MRARSATVTLTRLSPTVIAMPWKLAPPDDTWNLPPRRSAIGFHVVSCSFRPLDGAPSATYQR